MSEILLISPDSLLNPSELLLDLLDLFTLNEVEVGGVRVEFKTILLVPLFRLIISVRTFHPSLTYLVDMPFLQALVFIRLFDTSLQSLFQITQSHRELRRGSFYCLFKLPAQGRVVVRLLSRLRQ